MYCRRCDYPLEGLTSGVCPECGRGFDPADRSTYRVPREKAPNLGWYALPLGVLMVALAGVGMIGETTVRFGAGPTSMFDVIPQYASIGSASSWMHWIALAMIAGCVVNALLVWTRWRWAGYVVAMLVPLASLDAGIKILFFAVFSPLFLLITIGGAMDGEGWSEGFPFFAAAGMWMMIWGSALLIEVLAAIAIRRNPRTG